MKYKKEIKLLNGKVLLIRSCTAEDGKEVLENFIQTHSETDFLTTYPEESSFTVKEESDFLEKKENSEKEVELAAVVDGHIVGTAGIDALGDKYKIKHRAEFGISILKEFWGMGIGSALTSACIECAKSGGFSQLELEVVAENTVAVSLYKRAGFIEFGRNPRGFNSKISGFQEIVHMRLEL